MSLFSTNSFLDAEVRHFNDQFTLPFTEPRSEGLFVARF